jgi:hypothetical protein
MADKSGLEECPVLLECGHFEKHAIDGQTHMDCAECLEIAKLFGANVLVVKCRIMAFETREWHMKCQQCSSGKWTGKDRPAAARFRSEHGNRTGHRQIVLDYMIPDHVKKLWKQHYGRKKVPDRIIAIPRKDE